MYTTEEHLLALIRDAVPESLVIEYKQCDALRNDDKKKNEMSKDVSAFANSAGGTLVYGIAEDGHKPVAIQEGFDPAAISKEWIEHVIGSRIQRRIDGVRIFPIPLSSTQAA